MNETPYLLQVSVAVPVGLLEAVGDVVLDESHSNVDANESDGKTEKPKLNPTPQASQVSLTADFAE